MAALVQNLGTGRRKRAIARVFLRPGKGDITVNGRPADQYFSTQTGRAMIRQHAPTRHAGEMRQWNWV